MKVESKYTFSENDESFLAVIVYDGSKINRKCNQWKTSNSY